MVGCSGYGFGTWAVLTWRGGKLTNLPAPIRRTPRERDPGMVRDDGEWTVAGDRFTTEGGRRAAVACHDALEDVNRWNGTLTTCVWTDAGWREVSSRADAMPADKARNGCSLVPGLMRVQ